MFVYSGTVFAYSISELKIFERVLGEAKGLSAHKIKTVRPLLECSSTDLAVFAVLLICGCGQNFGKDNGDSCSSRAMQ